MCPVEIMAAGQRIHVMGANGLVETISALSIGDKVTVRGALRAHVWTTQNGQQHAAVHVIATEVIKDV